MAIEETRSKEGGNGCDDASLPTARIRFAENRSVWGFAKSFLVSARETIFKSNIKLCFY